jgi:hypothetical protein
MQNKIHENEFAKVWIDDGVMNCTFKTDTLTLEIAKECIQLRIEAAQGESYLTLIDAKNLKAVDKAARDYLGSDEGTKLIKASALLTESTVGKFMVNFFLQVNKPKIPTRLFNDKEDAIKWLHQFEKIRV